MDFDNSMKLSKNIVDTEIHLNKPAYKTIGSLNIYKHEHEEECEISFKCMGGDNYNDWIVVSGRKNNNGGLSHTLSWKYLESNKECINIDSSYCYSNQSYYTHLAKHIFVNNGTFYAKDVCNLAEYIVKYPFNLTRAHYLLSTIYLQYQLLLESEYSISYMDMEDILVIIIDGTDGTHYPLFFFSNYEKIYKVETIKNPDHPICSNDHIRVIHFYDHDNFVLPPELVDNTNIPFICGKSSWFYSLACLVLYCLNPDKINDGFRILCNSCENSNSKHDYTINQLSEYNGTKLYYTLLYCLTKEPCKREFILF